MNAHTQGMKAYEEKIGAQLKEAKAKLDEFEAHLKGKQADAEIELTQAMRTSHHNIEKKREQLKTAGEALATKTKADIDAELAKLKGLSEQLAARIKTRSATT
jgi:hypothetical protein